MPFRYASEPAKFWPRIMRRCAEAPFEVPIAAWFAMVGGIGVVSGRGIVPRTLEMALPIWLVQVWTVALFLGGFLSVLGKLRQSDRLEAAGLLMLGWGATLYGAILCAAGNWPAPIASAAAMFSIAIGCGVRLWVLRTAHSVKSVATNIREREARDE